MSAAVIASRRTVRSASVSYFDPNWEFLVPDVRWFPAENAATLAARALIALLRENARIGHAEAARRLRLSRTTVQARVESLERQYMERLEQEREHYMEDQLKPVLDYFRPYMDEKYLKELQIEDTEG